MSPRSPLKAFISYSHQDKEYMKEFKKHLNSLTRKSTIVAWHDKKLVAGDELDAEIKKHLLESDLVIFLVSVDFLTSFNCYEVELKTSLDRAKNGACRIISVIVRPCGWKDTPLKDYVIATEDAKSISEYGDKDAAWQEVVESIEKCVNKFSHDRERIPDRPAHQNKVRKRFVQLLDDTEVIFQHKEKEKIGLKDIFVFPDLRNVKREIDEFVEFQNSKDLLSISKVKDGVIVLGTEQIGKTSLAKMVFRGYFDTGMLPLLLNGRAINSAKLKKVTRKAIAEQYEHLNFELYFQQDTERILLVDDFDKSRLNAKYLPKFVQSALEMFSGILLFCDRAFRYDEPRFVELSSFSQYEIMPLGHVRRGELIEIWNSIGHTETIETKELHNKNDNTTRHLNSIIRKNILPAKPIYVLTILQLLETATPSDYSLTSYGYCYQSLIQNSLQRTNIRANDIDLYINYLTEFAYFLFDSEEDSISDDQLQQFQRDYSIKYLIESHEHVIDTLVKAGVLKKSHSKIYFGYRYIFYFYVAKYFADHLNIDECKSAVEFLCKNIHTERNANILIFVIHHTKDQAIIDEILLNAWDVFDKTGPANLDIGETQHLAEFLDSIPQLVVEQKNIEDERKASLEKMDEIDTADEDLQNPCDEDDAEKQIFKEINRAFRVTEIIGQILRNRHGSLTKSQLYDLADAAHSPGLRFLNFYLTMLRTDKEHIIELIQDVMKQNLSMQRSKIEKEARDLFLMLNYGVSFAVVKMIANSLGSEKLMAIFAEVADKNRNSPAMQLIYIAMKLEFTKSIPKREIEELLTKLENNPISKRLLQEVVIQHLYLNYMDYSDRQWLSDKLFIPLQSQLLLQAKSVSKKMPKK